MNKANNQNYYTYQSNLASYKDFIPSKEIKDLNKTERSFKKNEDDKGNLPNNKKLQFNKVTKTWQDLSKAEVKDKIKAAEKVETVKENNEEALPKKISPLSEFLIKYNIKLINPPKVTKEDQEIFVPTLDKQALFDFAKIMADQLIGRITGLGWNDLGDTNSLWDHIHVGMGAKELYYGVKTAVDDRLREDGAPEGLFDSIKHIFESDETMAFGKKLKIEDFYANLRADIFRHKEDIKHLIKIKEPKDISAYNQLIQLDRDFDNILHNINNK